MKFSIVAMPWSGEHRGFVVAAFLKISTFRAQ
jgi:hypothetical protein